MKNIKWYCDAPDCNAIVYGGEHPPYGWRTCLLGEGPLTPPTRDWTVDFCSWDCVRSYSSKLPDTMIVHPDEAPSGDSGS